MLLRRFSLAILATLTLCLMAWTPVQADQESGTVRVCNDSDFEIYVVIGGYNQGRIWKGSSEEYKVPLGNYKVEAEVGDEVAKEWVTLTARSPRDEVTFSNNDFPDAMLRSKKK
jgi:hypothetical protein